MEAAIFSKDKWREQRHVFKFWGQSMICLEPRLVWERHKVTIDLKIYQRKNSLCEKKNFMRSNAFTRRDMRTRCNMPTNDRGSGSIEITCWWLHKSWFWAQYLCDSVWRRQLWAFNGYKTNVQASLRSIKRSGWVIDLQEFRIDNLEFRISKTIISKNFWVYKAVGANARQYAKAGFQFELSFHYTYLYWTGYRYSIVLL